MSETRLGCLDCATAVRFSNELQLSLAKTENTKRPEFYVELVLTTPHQCDQPPSGAVRNMEINTYLYCKKEDDRLIPIGYKSYCLKHLYTCRFGERHPDKLPDWILKDPEDAIEKLEISIKWDYLWDLEEIFNNANWSEIERWLGAPDE